MIIVFILYFIFLIWLFEFIDIDNTYSSDKHLDSDVTIIIDQTDNIDDLFSTIDSIKSQSYDLNYINLIILDTSTEDIQSLVNNYKHFFSSIDVIKVSDINRIEALHSIEPLCRDYILFLENGISISESFISIIIKYLYQSNLSAIYVPLLYRYQNQYHIFYQLYNCFIESIRCSLINKNFNIFDQNVAIKKDSFLNFINQNHGHMKSQYLVAPELCLYKNKNKQSEINSNINIINVSYTVINFLFIFTLLQFLSAPDKYFLAIIIVKIIPELSLIYTFYNRLQIKFPKFDYLIFSVIAPFYSMIELIHNQVIAEKN